MDKIIRVIRYKGKYIEETEYSQGYRSESLTDDPLKALDLASTPYNAAFVWECYKKLGGVIETYKVSINLRSDDGWSPEPYERKDTSKHTAQPTSEV